MNKRRHKSSRRSNHRTKSDGWEDTGEKRRYHRTESHGWEGKWGSGRMKAANGGLEGEGERSDGRTGSWAGVGSDWRPDQMASGLDAS